MYATINTINANSDTLGSIVSLHRTERAAREAIGRLQRRIRRDNASADLPVIIVRTAHWIGVGAIVSRYDASVELVAAE